MANILSALPGIVLAFVIVVFMLGLGSTMVSDLRDQSCEDLGGTYGTFIENHTDHTDATTAYKTGCCLSTFASTIPGVQSCDNTTSASYSAFNYTRSINTTNSGLEGLDNMASWTPTLGLAIMIGVVVAVLVGFLGFAIGGRKTTGA